MNPMDLAPPAEVFGSAAAVVAVVEVINRSTPPEFSGRWLLLIGAVASVLVTGIWAFAHQPIDWTQIPLDSLTSWIVAVGGRKILMTAAGK